MRHLNRIVSSALVAAATLSVAPAFAATQSFSINANGAKEVTGAGVPNQGDLDGTSVGTITFDNGTGSGTTGSATFSLTLTNIDLTDLRGHHIHQAPSTTNGPIVIDFGDPDAIRTANVLSGTIGGLNAVTISSIFSNPTAFYYNTHNAPFPGGAVRDQLVPEPTALAAVGAVATLVARRRRR